MPRFHDQEQEDRFGSVATHSPAAAALVSAAERAADEILAEAREDAMRMRAEAGADAERMRREGEEEARDAVGAAREAVDDILHRATALSEQLEQLGTALHRNAQLLIADVRAAHHALRAEADAAAAILPAPPPVENLDVRVTRNRDLPFEPPAFEIPASLRARR